MNGPTITVETADRAAEKTRVSEAAPVKREGGKEVFVLGLLIAMFLVIESFVPMRTAVQIGADEGFELAKATLCVQGHRLYTEVWNDQPPLHTFLVKQILKHVSGSVLGPRFLTVGFSVVLLVAVFVIVRRVSGLTVAAVATGMIIASPGFIELSSSCMLEIPALAMALAGIALLRGKSRGFTEGNEENEGGEFALTPTLSPAEREIRSTPFARRYGLLVIAGAVFGLGLQMKLVPIIYLPLVGLIEVINGWGKRDWIKRAAVQMALFGSGLVVAYVGADLVIERGAYLTHFGQSWKSHFGAVKASAEYGSPGQHPFDWSVLAKNWDVTVPAVIGVLVLIWRLGKVRPHYGRNDSVEKELAQLALTPTLSPRERVSGGALTTNGASRNAQFAAASFRKHAHQNGRRRTDEPSHRANDGSPSPGGEGRGEGELSSYAALIVPLVWLALTFTVFGIHKPWWAYYYLHTAIPLCWCAAISIGLFGKWIGGLLGTNGLRQGNGRRGKTALAWLVVGATGLFVVCGAGWMVARVYLQVANLRAAPKIESTPVIAQLQRFRPYVQWLYADKLVYSFHGGIPVVPSLAVMPVKRLWSGELDNAGIRRELERYKPGVMVLLNDGRDVPFKDLLDAQYQMVYMDSDNRMYALREIARKVMLTEE